MNKKLIQLFDDESMDEPAIIYPASYQPQITKMIEEKLEPKIIINTQFYKDFADEIEYLISCEAHDHYEDDFEIWVNLKQRNNQMIKVVSN